MSKRRKFSAEEKYRIIEEAHQPGVSTAEVCRRHGIAASAFYRWEAQMREDAKEALADQRGRKEKAAEAENERLRAQQDHSGDAIVALDQAGAGEVVEGEALGCEDAQQTLGHAVLRTSSRRRSSASRSSRTWERLPSSRTMVSVLRTRARKTRSSTRCKYTK